MNIRVKASEFRIEPQIRRAVGMRLEPERISEGGETRAFLTNDIDICGSWPTRSRRAYASSGYGT